LVIYQKELRRKSKPYKTKIINYNEKGEKLTKKGKVDMRSKNNSEGLKRYNQELKKYKQILAEKKSNAPIVKLIPEVES
jgi:hypothetical protein